MSYEIELKAHVAADDVSDVRSRLMTVPGIRYIGETDKFDIYWAKKDDGEPVFLQREFFTETIGLVDERVFALSRLDGDDPVGG